jgi:hypothetical protein
VLFDYVETWQPFCLSLPLAFVFETPADFFARPFVPVFSIFGRAVARPYNDFRGFHRKTQ